MAVRLDAEQRAQALFAEPFVREYIRLLDEGWNPDFKEFLQRVPDELREDVFTRIDTVVANRSGAAESARRIAEQPENAGAGQDEHVADQAAGAETADAEATDSKAVEEETAKKIIIIPEHVDVVPDPVSDPAPAPAPPETDSTRSISSGVSQSETLSEPEMPFDPDADTATDLDPEACGIEVGEQVAPAHDAAMDPELANGPVKPNGFADRLVKPASSLVPWDLRMRFRKDLQQKLWELRRWGAFGPQKVRAVIAFVLNGFAQHAPLHEPHPRADGSARGGWLAWRLSGPLLLAGTVLGLPALLGTGAGLLIVGLLSLATNNVRLTNAVLGGGIVVLALAFLGGIATASLVTAALLAGSTSAASGAVAGLALWFTGVLATVTGSGWSPSQWGVSVPKRKA